MSEELRQTIRDTYGRAAQRAAAGNGSCCTTDCCADDPAAHGHYDPATAAEVPAAAVAASLGCGNPTALAELHPGEVVLDLGSGGGLDVLLSARRVGPTGKAIGLDMTDEMLDLARRNAREAGARNVEFLKGEIEAIPLPDTSVDVILSNCVINLSADKRRVLREAFRVLRPGGRLAVSDVVIQGALDPADRHRMERRVGCVAGALEETEFLGLLREAGFVDAAIEPTRTYDPGQTRTANGDPPSTVNRGAPNRGRLVAAFVRARKPGAREA